MKVVKTFKIDEELLKKAEAVASILGMPFGAFVRMAIAKEVDRFQNRGIEVKRIKKVEVDEVSSDESKSRKNGKRTVVRSR